MDAFNLAIYYLERRARTEREIRDRLARKGFTDVTIDEAIARLKKIGYLDDRRLAKNWQESRDRYKPTGLSRIKIDLIRRGIDRAVVGELETDQEKEYQLAMAAAQGRWRQYAALPPTTRRRRLTAFLIRRGFAYPAVKRVMEVIDPN